MTRQQRTGGLWLACVGLWAVSHPALGADLASALKTLNSVTTGGKQHSEAMLAWRTASGASAEQLPVLLKALDDSKPLGANWIRAAIDQIAERATENGRALPNQALETAISDEDFSPRARRLAYEWLLRVDASAKARIIPRMLDSSSLEMRRDAVAERLLAAAELGDSPKAVDIFEQALSAARDQDQIEEAFEALTKRGAKVDLARHFGFLLNWQLIGPFDNTDKSGFDMAYGPESSLDLAKTYAGKKGDVRWQAHTTEDKFGMVNLNEAIGKNMGAIAYALADFQATEARPVDLRLGCICAAKVWLNGELKMSHEVYHSGTKIDQYVAQGKLRPGRNTILVKVCQNEQTEPWAQDWQFQLRVCDQLGTAVLAKGR